jgi:hypothetical protein
VFWCAGAEFVMGGVVEVGSAVRFNPIACVVWRVGC